MTKAKKILGKVNGIFYGLIAVALFFAVTADGFFSYYNITTMLKDSCPLIIVSLGVSMCILAGRNNISVGASMSLCGIVTALCQNNGIGVFPSIMAGILVGFIMGCIIGYMIAYCGFNYWIVTYAFMGIAQGLAYGLCNGNTVGGLDSVFREFSNNTFLGIYLAVWLTAIICVIFVFISYKTRFGYNIYAIGGSEKSAVLAGIKVKRNVFAIYAITGFLSAISGILLLAKSNSASSIAGSSYEFDAIAAVIIGGTTFEGGTGKITGSIMGAILMRMLRNGLNMIGLSSYWQTLIIGLIVLLIVVLDTINERRKMKNATRRLYHT